MSDRDTLSRLAQARLPLALLAGAGFLSALGARIVDPLLVVLARDFETTVAAAAILVSAFTLPYGLNQLLLGPLSDRFGKLRILLLSLSGYTVFMTLCGLATDLPALIILRACAGACSAGLIPTCLAYIGDNVPYEQRHIALSRFLTGVVLGQALAGPIGGFFGEILSWRGVFWTLGGLGLVTTLLVAVRVRSLPLDQNRGAVFSQRNYRLLLQHPPARLLLLVTILEGILLPGTFPFFAPYMTEHFGLSYLAVGLILLAFGVGALGYTRLAPILMRSLGETGMVLAGGMIIAGSVAVGLSLDVWPFFIIVEMALGLGYFMLHSVMQARATELLPEARATAVSSFVFMLFLGQGLGALVMGVLINGWGYKTAFAMNIVGTMFLTIWLSVYMFRTHPSRMCTQNS